MNTIVAVFALLARVVRLRSRPSSSHVVVMPPQCASTASLYLLRADSVR